MRFRLRGAVQQVAGPMRMVTVPARADGDQTSKVTQAGPVTMTPPVKAVKARPAHGQPGLGPRSCKQGLA
jgi:hypothetical protein